MMFSCDEFKVFLFLSLFHPTHPQPNPAPHDQPHDQHISPSLYSTNVAHPNSTSGFASSIHSSFSFSSSSPPSSSLEYTLASPEKSFLEYRHHWTSAPSILTIQVTFRTLKVNAFLLHHMLEDITSRDDLTKVTRDGGVMTSRHPAEPGQVLESQIDWEEGKDREGTRGQYGSREKGRIPEGLRDGRVVEEVVARLKRGIVVVSYLMEGGMKITSVKVGRALSHDQWHRLTITVNHLANQLIVHIDGSRLHNVSLPSRDLHGTLWSDQGRPEVTQASREGGTATIHDVTSFVSRLSVGGYRPEANQRGHFTGCVKDVRMFDVFMTSSESSVIAAPHSSGDVLAECRNLCLGGGLTPQGVGVDRMVGGGGGGSVCKNGGRCINHYVGVTCDCYGTGAEGEKCENREMSLTLLGSDWLIYSFFDPRSPEDDPVRQQLRWNKLAIKFKTSSTEGILFYAREQYPQYNHLAVSLRNSSLHVSVIFVSKLAYSELCLSLGNNLNDNKWHTVMLIHDGRAVDVSLDDVTERMTSEADDARLHLPSTVYFGGMDVSASILGLRSQKNFVGCLRQIFFNQINILDELSSSLSHPPPSSPQHPSSLSSPLDGARVRYHSVDGPLPVLLGCQSIDTTSIQFTHEGAFTKIEHPGVGGHGVGVREEGVAKQSLDIELSLRTLRGDCLISYTEIMVGRGKGFVQLSLTGGSLDVLLAKITRSDDPNQQADRVDGMREEEGRRGERGRGKGGEGRVVLGHRLNDNNWHKIRVLFLGSSSSTTGFIQVEVDGAVAVDSSLYSIVVGDATYLGFGPTTEMNMAFIGCLKKVKVQGVDLDPVAVIHSQLGVGVTLGDCSLVDWCETNTSRCNGRGRCVSEWAGPTCDCAENYDGPTCQRYIEYDTVTFHDVTSSFLLFRVTTLNLDDISYDVMFSYRTPQSSKRAAEVLAPFPREGDAVPVSRERVEGGAVFPSREGANGGLAGAEGGVLVVVYGERRSWSLVVVLADRGRTLVTTVVDSKSTAMSNVSIDELTAGGSDWVSVIISIKSSSLDGIAINGLDQQFVTSVQLHDLQHSNTDDSNDDWNMSATMFDITSSQTTHPDDTRNTNVNSNNFNVNNNNLNKNHNVNNNNLNSVITSTEWEVFVGGLPPVQDYPLLAPVLSFLDPARGERVSVDPSASHQGLGGFVGCVKHLQVGEYRLELARSVTAGVIGVSSGCNLGCHHATGCNNLTGCDIMNDDSRLYDDDIICDQSVDNGNLETFNAQNIYYSETDSLHQAAKTGPYSGRTGAKGILTIPFAPVLHTDGEKVGTEPRRRTAGGDTLPHTQGDEGRKLEEGVSRHRGGGGGGGEGAGGDGHRHDGIKMASHRHDSDVSEMEFLNGPIAGNLRAALLETPGLHRDKYKSGVAMNGAAIIIIVIIVTLLFLILFTARQCARIPTRARPAGTAPSSDLPPQSSASAAGEEFEGEEGEETELIPLNEISPCLDTLNVDRLVPKLNKTASKSKRKTGGGSFVREVVGLGFRKSAGYCKGPVGERGRKSRDVTSSTDNDDEGSPMLSAKKSSSSTNARDSTNHEDCSIKLSSINKNKNMHKNQTAASNVICQNVHLSKDLSYNQLKSQILACNRFSPPHKITIPHPLSASLSRNMAAQSAPQILSSHHISFKLPSELPPHHISSHLSPMSPSNHNSSLLEPMSPSSDTFHHRLESSTIPSIAKHISNAFRISPYCASPSIPTQQDTTGYSRPPSWIEGRERDEEEDGEQMEWDHQSDIASPMLELC